jgi:protein-S-isoprenylcysteine O-methyltransferase Ste14
MTGYLAVLTIALMIGMVAGRVFTLKKQGVSAMQFGRIDRTDFSIPPFALLYIYLVIAAAFDLPSPSRQAFFHSAFISWSGVLFCLAGLLLLLGSLVSFGRSFRIGIDQVRPDSLVISGVFAFSRNPIYTAFAIILLG